MGNHSVRLGRLRLEDLTRPFAARVQSGDEIVRADALAPDPPAARVAVGVVDPRFVDRFAEEAPHEPAPLHVDDVPEQLERSPAGRKHARAQQLVAQPVELRSTAER